MRAIVDTNVLIAGLLWHGPPHALLEHLRAGALILVSSPPLMAEFERVINRSKFDAALLRSQTSRERCIDEIRTLAQIIDAPPLPQTVCRDPGDDMLLALASAARVDILVSGDLDLLTIGSFAGVNIVSPAQALLRLTNSKQNWSVKP